LAYLRSISLNHWQEEFDSRERRHGSDRQFDTALNRKHQLEDNMNATQQLHNLGQSLGLDNITRDLLDDGTLKRYIDDFSVTGLASNPTIFEHAISKSKSHDPEIIQLAGTGISGEQLFFELASIRCDLSMC
jgi:hypothetical protein